MLPDAAAERRARLARCLRGAYAIVDPDHCGGRDALEVAEALLAGGASALQLRAKRLGSRAALELGRALAAACARAGAGGALFVMNDRVDLAVAAGAGAVHLGQDDLPLQAARALAPGLLAGVSTHTLDQARDAAAAGADYLGFGPVFATPSKERPDPVVGLAGLAAAVRAVAPLPIVAIGGVEPAHAAALAATGAAAAAAIRAFGGAAEPRAAVAAFLRAWSRG
ncbi:MAG TPA: thiamine phosphate synthase [Myxococcota bacterium]|jgi:thiamine-phosphate diphosphorylase|nr:thiamine phosphate synthase [Myxococcota bacterium]